MSAYLLAVTLLMSAGFASAGSARVAARTRAVGGCALELNTFSSSTPSLAESTHSQFLGFFPRVRTTNSSSNALAFLFPAILASTRPSVDDRLGINHTDASAPVPKPITAILFGVALLIGGGILRRRRGRTG
jgi:hypothetical protein